MSFSLFTPSRTVLMICDEALFIYSTSAKGVRLMDTVPWSVENFEEDVAIIISKDCGGKPVLIINDMVEQHYRKEKIPRVSAMDKQNVVKRKLHVAFPNYPIRAALPLKEKVAKTSSSMAGSIYIFAAVPATEAFAKTMAATRRSLAAIVGFCLLPVESSDMIKKLADKLSVGNNEKAQWTIFMGQHKNGGLRQIVIRNGELALTRMTPIVENDDDPLAWAKDVHQEFQATMSYLSRFGFDPSDGLNIILLSESGTGDIVDELMTTPCNFYSVTIEDAAKLLKLPIGVQDTSYHADALHMAWVGRKTSFILPMKAKQIESVSKPRQLAAFASIVLLFCGTFQAYQMFDYVQQNLEINSSIKEVKQRKMQLDLRYSKEIKRKESLGYDIQLIQSSLALNDAFEEKQIDALHLLYNVGLALGRDMRIDRIDVKRGQKNFAQKIMNSNSKTPLFFADMQMSFPSTTNAEKGNREIEMLQGRLQKSLPDHMVSITKLLEDYEYSEEIVVETGDAKSAQSMQDYVAEISIEGPEK